MTEIRRTLGIKPEAATAAPKAPQIPRFKCTISSTARKAPAPLVFYVEAPDGKVAALNVRKLIAFGKLDVVPA